MKISVMSDCRGMDANDTVAQIMCDRGIHDPYHFLNPTIDDMLPLTDLKNIEEAATIVVNALDSWQKIGILGDVDVDGVTSAAIIYRYLKKLKPEADISTFINQGKCHGLQAKNLDDYKDCNLLIIVDSLDSTTEQYQAVLTDSNVLDIIVLDHHAITPGIDYDKWVTLVSSQRDYSNTELSGAGVCMKFVLYLDQMLKKDYAKDLYDLAASGLSADMMDMTVPENRYIMSKGLAQIDNPAIKRIAGGGFGWNSKSIQFSIAPIVNAGVRLGKNENALDVFLVDDDDEVKSNVNILKKCREEQNREVAALMESIDEQCEAQLDKKMIVVFIETDHGIAGLVGNKLLEKYERPVIILLDYGDKYIGSMRAVGVDDFRQMINDSGLAESFGHELAAGIEIKKENLQKFIDYMEEHLPDFGAYEESIVADIWADVADIDRYWIDRIQEVNAISGKGFPSVKVYIDGIRDYEVGDMSKGKHLVIHLADSQLTLIKWNFNGDWDYFYDAEMMGEELEAVVEVQSGLIGRTFMLQGIIDYIGVKE